MASRIRQLASFDFYSKAQTDVKVVELSPPTDLSNYYTKSQTNGKVVELAPATDLSNYYIKSETDGKIVTLSPPTDLTPYYNKTQVDTIINTLKGTASTDFDTLGELEIGIDANELTVVHNAAAIVAAQDAIITNHP